MSGCRIWSRVPVEVPNCDIQNGPTNGGQSVMIQVTTTSNVSGSLLYEVGKWYGDLTTAVWDLSEIPNLS